MQKLRSAKLVALLLLFDRRDATAFVVSAPRVAGTQRQTVALSRRDGTGPLVGRTAAVERLQSRSTTTVCGGPIVMGLESAYVGRAVGNKLVAAAVATGGIISRRTAVVGAAIAAVGLVAALAVKVLDTPSRPYDAEANTVGNEYDAWTEDGILESYWGEHIHLGYYNAEERKKGAFRKDFIQAKYDFIDEMAKWGGVRANAEDTPKKVLDVGCGVGGTSRYLAKKLGRDTSVTGITLSPKQVERATQLAKEQGVHNAKFQVTNALDMTFEDDSFDLVWACESGEHMPDKGKYIDEMTRVLKPGGRLVVATWCQRDNSTQPFTPAEEKKLDFLYSEWTHPHFISINDYAKLMEGTGQLEQVESADWAEQTTPTWRLSIWVGVVNPWPWLRVPKSYYKTVRDAWCIERMHQAFKTGLMQYGMIKSIKKSRAPDISQSEQATGEESARITAQTTSPSQGDAGAEASSSSRTEGLFRVTDPASVGRDSGSDGGSSKAGQFRVTDPADVGKDGGAGRGSSSSSSSSSTAGKFQVTDPADVAKPADGD